MHSHEPYDCELRSGGGCGSRGLMSMDPSRLRTSRSTLKAFEQTVGSCSGAARAENFFRVRNSPKFERVLLITLQGLVGSTHTAGGQTPRTTVNTCVNSGRCSNSG